MVNAHVGTMLLAASASKPFSLAMIPDGTIPWDGVIKALTYVPDARTGRWLVRWIREEED